MKKYENWLKKQTETLIKLFKRNPLWLTAIIGGVLSLIIFAIIYGFGLVNPTNVEWLKLDFNDALSLGFDIKQHYLGWLWYRNAPWTWPLGIITTQAYPSGISVMYLDSIPLLAILFKLFAVLLPSNFQYFGIWQLICFILQGALAAIIIRKATSKISVIIPCTLLFIFSPVFLTRVFFHIALSSQWLILLCIALLLYGKSLTFTKRLIAWSVVFVLAILIHPYFLPTLAVLFAAEIIIYHQTIRKTILEILIPVGLALLVFWAVDGFVPASLNTGGLGFHPFDLVSPLMPQGWSFASVGGLTIIEETSYLGLGVICLMIISLAIFGIRLASDINFRFALGEWFESRFRPRYLAVCAVFLLLFLLAVSPSVRINSQVILTFPLPAFVDNFWGIFRSSSRFIWPIYYLFIIGVVFGAIKLLRKSPRVLIAICLLSGFVQVIDVGLSPNTMQPARDVHTVQSMTHHPRLDVSRWRKFVQGKKHLVFIDDKMSNEDSYALSDVAVDAGLTMNQAYYARLPKDSIYQTKIEARQQLERGRLDHSVVYVTRCASWVNLHISGTQVLDDDGFYAIITN